MKSKRNLKMTGLTFLACAAAGWAGLVHAQEDAPDPKTVANTIILNSDEVRNLGIETQLVSEGDFELTGFALGRIEAIPSRQGVVSTRVAGRVVKLNAHEGDTVAANQTVAEIESRQPGDPPPRIELKTPISGLVTKSHVKLGEPVEPSKAILEVVDLSEVYAVARVPEDLAAMLEPGTEARITVPGLRDGQFEGKMLRFETAADRESGTLGVVFLLSNPGGRLLPDMRAEFSLVLGTRANVTTVPRSALQGDAANPVVFVRKIGLTNAFLRLPVQIGEQNDRSVEIVSKFFPADEVVVKGAYQLFFAGNGSISLKEKLDADHGHPHNEDGSRQTKEQAAELEPQKTAESGGEVSGARGPTYVFLVGSNILLLMLLILVGLSKKPKEEVAEQTGDTGSFEIPHTPN